MKIKTSHICRYIVLILIFLAGGTLQYFSIISITKTNLIIVLFMVLCLLAKVPMRMIFIYLSSLWVLFIYLLFILLVSIYHHNDSTTFFAYSLSALFPIIVFSYVRGIVFDNSKSIWTTLNFFFLLLIVQLPVMVMQFYYAGHFLLDSKVNINAIDLIFGTFFIRSDATVGLFVNMLFLHLIFFRRQAWKRKIIVLYLLAMLTVILLVNSLLSKVVFLFIMVMYLVKNYVKLNKFLTASIFFMLLVLVIAIGVNIDFVKYYTIACHARAEILSNISRYPHANVPRYSVLLLLFNKVPFLGNGLFDYYNYLTKEWSFFAGHSLWLSLYNDTGPIGVLLIVLFYWRIFLSSAENKLVGFAQFAMAMSYSVTGFLLYDVGALFILAFFSCLNRVESPIQSL